MSPAAARLLVRDALITAACACLWWLDIRAELTGIGGTVVSVLAGLSTGVVAFVAHEWGHAMGSKLSGATIYFADRIISPFLFFFDTDASTKNQFVAMSMGGGYVASAVMMPLRSSDPAPHIARRQRPHDHHIRAVCADRP